MSELPGNSSHQRKHTVEANLIPKGYEQLTSLATAATLTVPTDARIALIRAEDQNVRWRDDGTAPTASVGMQLAVDEDILYTGNLSAIQFIEETTSAKVNVSYYA